MTFAMKVKGKAPAPHGAMEPPTRTASAAVVRSLSTGDRFADRKRGKTTMLSQVCGTRVSSYCPRGAVAVRASWPWRSDTRDMLPSSSRWTSAGRA